MAVPDFQSMMLPLLQFMKDGQIRSIKDCKVFLSQHFNMSEDEMQEVVPSQKQTKLNNRVNWATTYMKKAGLLESAGRGLYTITSEGAKVLNSKPAGINIAFLKKYPSFVDFQSRAESAEGTVPNQPEAISEETQTPEESIDEKYNIIRKALAQEVVEKVIAQTPAFFEQLVVELLVKMGYGGSIEEAGKAIGKSGDEGIDGIIKEDKLGLDIIYLQAKRWQKGNVVSRPELQKFVGALAGQGAKKGVFLTTSSFTRDAREYIPRNETKIVLIDGEQLAQLMIDYNIGVSSVKSYEIKKIDLDYFEE